MHFECILKQCLVVTICTYYVHKKNLLIYWTNVNKRSSKILKMEENFPNHKWIHYYSLETLFVVFMGTGEQASQILNKLHIFFRLCMLLDCQNHKIKLPRKIQVFHSLWNRNPRKNIWIHSEVKTIHYILREN